MKTSVGKRVPDLAEPEQPSSNIHDQIVDHYKSLEVRFCVRSLSSDVSYVSPVNFTESMAEPRHRWFPYKEGFSPLFVKSFLDEHLEKGAAVLDPFGGVGTTAVLAGTLGIDSFSFDVSPLAHFIASTKSLTLSRAEILEFTRVRTNLEKANLQTSADFPANQTVVSYFETNILECLMKIKAFILAVESPKIRDLLFLAFLSEVEHFSTHRRAGNGVKRKSRMGYTQDPSLIMEQIRSRLLEQLARYASDLETLPMVGDASIYRTSSLNSSSYTDVANVGLVLTSPPYANCFDYSKIYMRELWLGDFFKSKSDQAQFRAESVRSHVHATWGDRNDSCGNNLVDSLIAPALGQTELWSRKIPSMLSGYFKDIGQLLAILRPRLNENTTLGFVVSNSFYGGLPIATDLLLAETAEKHGYKVKSVDVYRGMIPSSQQYKKIEDKYFMRESLVVLKQS